MTPFRLRDDIIALLRAQGATGDRMVTDQLVLDRLEALALEGEDPNDTIKRVLSGDSPAMH